MEMESRLKWRGVIIYEYMQQICMVGFIDSTEMHNLMDHHVIFPLTVKYNNNILIFYEIVIYIKI